MSNITICTLGIGDEMPFFDLTNKNKKEYCQANGYELVIAKELLDDKTDCNLIQRSCWSKFILMDNIIASGKSKFVWWVDADMWIFNMGFKLEQLCDDTHSLFVTVDGGLNLGIFGMPCNLHSRSLLWNWYNRDHWRGHVWGESMACNEWYHGLFDYTKEIKIINRPILNTYISEKNGPCNIVHLVGENKNARHEYFRQCDKGVIK